MSDATPPPPPPPPPADNSGAGGGGGGESPGLGVRFGARLVDALLISIPLGIVFGSGGFNVIESILTSLIGFAYIVWFEANRNGQTFGKQALSLRVVSDEGGSPTMEQAVRRNAWLLLGLIPLVGGPLSLLAVIWIVIGISGDAANLGPHDKMANARVVAA